MEKEKHAYTSCAVPEELFEAIKEIVTPEEMEEAVFTDEKQVREENIRVIREKLEEAFAENEELAGTLRRSIISVSEEDCPQDDLKRSQASGWKSDRSDQTACSRD